MSSIFEKTLRLRGNPELASRAMTLMIADVQGVVSGMTNIHEVWAGVIETGIAAWLLQRQVGLACLPVVGLGIGTHHRFYCFGTSPDKLSYRMCSAFDTGCKTKRNSTASMVREYAEEATVYIYNHQLF